MAHGPVGRIVAFVALLYVLIWSTIGYSSMPADALNNSPESRFATLGIINMKGQWIVPPRYLEIIYVKKIDAYWVKQPALPASSPASDATPTPTKWSIFPDEDSAKNRACKLLDRNGVELKSWLPSDREPMCEQPEQAIGVTMYPDVLTVRDKHGLGYCDPYGRPITDCIYYEINDVGDGLWMVRQPYRKPPMISLYEIFVPPGLGGDQPPPPPYEFLDHAGRRVATLPANLMRPRGQFTRGLLACDFTAPSCIEGAVDRTGKIAIAPGNPVPLECERYHAYLDKQKAKKFKFIYQQPSSSSQTVKFIPESEDTKAQNFRAPIEVTDDMALVSINNGEEDLSGLVDRSGRWVVKPNYDRLAYCAPDRLVASQAHFSRYETSQLMFAIYKRKWSAFQ